MTETTTSPADYSRETRVLARAAETLARVARSPEADPAAEWSRSVVDVALVRAVDLCRKAWNAPYVREGCGRGIPSIQGNCENKSLWLQSRLGGVVLSGWKPKQEHHAVLLFACEGDLFIADHGRVVPVGDYREFFVDGFYHRGGAHTS
ncbi:hypothetical protein T8K17_18010 [Thalassobaculum sp. OXR-137]|uniref:hypothetical protein n=1 Tax=Thalassobaculum sp. OXR-137 TaxID=3100173 RepID=UPI002AC9E485|nr:hypothetical protein [Thalassobaculum sp. OXR-137]WPZ33126.1 hypothetical protein T8K17_18010 [Thalassobaculum sp. OXR-137]